MIRIDVNVCDTAYSVQQKLAEWRYGTKKKNNNFYRNSAIRSPITDFLDYATACETVAYVVSTGVIVVSGTACFTHVCVCAVVTNPRVIVSTFKACDWMNTMWVSSTKGEIYFAYFVLLLNVFLFLFYLQRFICRVSWNAFIKVTKIATNSPYQVVVKYGVGQ